MNNDAVERARRVFRGARSITDVGFLVDQYLPEAGLNAGGDRVALLLDSDPVAVTGSAQPGETPSFEVFFVRERSIIAWAWTSDTGSIVTVHPRRDLVSLTIDSAPGLQVRYDAPVSFTIVYPWGSLFFSSENEWTRGAVAELLTAFLHELEDL